MRVPCRSFTCGLLAVVAVARGDGPQAARSPQLETSSYNISELIHSPLKPLSNAATTGGGGGGGGNAAAFHSAPGNPSDADDVASRTGQLLTVIQQSIDPGSWRNNGGTTGTLATMDDVLVVTQTPADQRAVADLLAGLLRSGDRGSMIRIDAAWMLLTSTEMARRPDQSSPTITADNVYCQARAVGFSGQSQTVNVQRATSVVTALTPVVAPGVALFQPTTESVQSGVTLSVTPRLSADHASLLVDVDSSVSANVARADPPLATTRPANTDDASAASLQAFANRPDHSQQQISTTVRLRPGVPLIVGGMSDQPASNGEHRALCLVLTAYVDDKATKAP